MRTRRYSVVPFRKSELSGPEMLLKLLKIIVSSGCRVSNHLQVDVGWQLTVTRQNNQTYEFRGFDETMEPLVEAYNVWRTRRSEWCPDHVSSIDHRDVLIRKTLELLLLTSADGEPNARPDNLVAPQWMGDCSLPDLARAVYLVYEGAKLDDLEQLLDLDDDLNLPFGHDVD